MCKECGCGEGLGNNRLQFNAKGYTEDSAKEVEKVCSDCPALCTFIFTRTTAKQLLITIRKKLS